ncbi:hypothetical protein NMY22_g19576 [Coprinellus aureogranulatus]|nr:hypothetical protein NMY22_g19576 [Coprinellus aureogranulatus]
MSSDLSLKPNVLKRPCSSLDSNNLCSACGKTFGAPHFLKKHQRTACSRTKKELEDLQKKVAEIASGSREHKRRRLSEDHSVNGHNPSPQHGSGPASGSGTLNTHPESGHQLPQQAYPSTEQDSAAGNPTDRPTPVTSAAGPQAGAIDRAMNVPEKICAESFRLQRRYLRPPQNDPDLNISSRDRYDSRNHREEKTQEVGPGVMQTEEGSGGVTGSAKGSGNDLDSNVKPAGVAEKVSGQGTQRTEASLLSDKPNPYAPFPNRSSFELGEWFHGQGTQKSLKDFKALVNILSSPTFSLDEIEKTPWTTVFQELGKNKEDMRSIKSQWIDDSGWKTTNREQKMNRAKGHEKRTEKETKSRRETHSPSTPSQHNTPTSPHPKVNTWCP